MLSQILLTIAVLLVPISTFFHQKAAKNWAINILNENNNPPLEEKKFTRIGQITFILAAVLGFLSFYI